MNSEVKRPSTVNNLLLEYDEKIRMVFNESSLLDFLSGDNDFLPFCILTDLRLYSFFNIKSKKDGDCFFANASDIENIKDIRLGTGKSRSFASVNLIVIAALLILSIYPMCFLIKLPSVLSGVPYHYAWVIVFFFLTVFGSGIFSVVLLKQAFKKTTDFYMEIVLKSGELLRLKVQGNSGSTTVQQFKHAFLSVKASQTAENPDVFLL